MVLTGGFLALAIANTLTIVGLRDGELRTWAGLQRELYSSVIVDPKGRFLLVGANAYSVDADATAVWELPLSERRPIQDEWARCRPIFSARLKVLVAACNDGFLYGIRVDDTPKLIWKKPAYTEGLFRFFVGPGVGEVFVASISVRASEASVELLNGKTGSLVTRIRQASGIFSAASHGLLASVPSFALLSSTGEAKWRLEADHTYRSGLVICAKEEVVLAAARGRDSRSRLALYSMSDGRELVAPTAEGTPVAVGADGTFYALSCDVSAVELPAAQPYLVAYNGALNELWRVQLPVPSFTDGRYPCPSPGVALGQDGNMYLSATRDGTYILAIRTDSPGPAVSPWPLWSGPLNGGRWAE
jgi:outer membrane protein assembly factor BamB